MKRSTPAPPLDRLTPAAIAQVIFPYLLDLRFFHMILVYSDLTFVIQASTPLTSYLSSEYPHCGDRSS